MSLDKIHFSGSSESGDYISLFSVSGSCPYVATSYRNDPASSMKIRAYLQVDKVRNCQTPSRLSVMEMGFYVAAIFRNLYAAICQVLSM